MRENISIRDLRTIFETLAECGVTIKDTEILTENVRGALFRTITENIKSDQGDVPLFTLDRRIEDSVTNALIETEQGQQLNLDPKTTQSILASLNEKIEEATEMGEKMIVLCSPNIRSHFKRLTEKFIPNLIVVSHNELSSNAKIRIPWNSETVMYVKKFEAETMNEAFNKIKQELGPDAIILKTTTNKGIKRAFKKNKIEITAAISEKNYIKKSKVDHVLNDQEKEKLYKNNSSYISKVINTYNKSSPSQKNEKQKLN